MHDPAELYSNVKDLDESVIVVTVIIQNTQKIRSSDSLFYTPVAVGNRVTLTAMLDSGSKACSE